MSLKYITWVYTHRETPNISPLLTCIFPRYTGITVFTFYGRRYASVINIVTDLAEKKLPTNKQIKAADSRIQRNESPSASAQC